MPKTKGLSIIGHEVLLDIAEAISANHLPNAVIKAVDFMNSNLDSSLDLSVLSERSGVSKHHLIRIFTKHTGDPPLRYFRKRKMKFAGQVLVSTSLLVKEVASMVGFDNPLHFSSVFRKEMGESPLQYRKAHGSSLVTDEERRTLYV